MNILAEINMVTYSFYKTYVVAAAKCNFPRGWYCTTANANNILLACS